MSFKQKFVTCRGFQNDLLIDLLSTLKLANYIMYFTYNFFSVILNFLPGHVFFHTFQNIENIFRNRNSKISRILKRIFS